VSCVRSICAEGGAGRPALRGEYAVTEAGSVVSPGGILGIVGDAGTALEFVSKLRNSGDTSWGILYFFGAARPIAKLVDLVWGLLAEYC
jgi:hypothetical protein